MWVAACTRISMRTSPVLRQIHGVLAPAGALSAEQVLSLTRRYARASDSILEDVEDAGESAGRKPQGERANEPAASLAKSLACLNDESLSPDRRKPLTRMETKRLIELRIKKRVKAQYSNGKYHQLMSKMIADAATLQDAYNIIRLNSNVDLTSAKDDVCFVSLAEQLAAGRFDVESNALSLYSKSKSKECLVLPNLNLRIIQEAIRIVLEIVYRPHFSKISHGSRSGRGHWSALNYISKEIGKHDWWFGVSFSKIADDNMFSKLIVGMEEMIEDTSLFSFLRRMFDANVLNLVFGDFPKGQGLPQEGVLSPILMNIYLDNFDCEVFRICMRYEGLNSQLSGNKNVHTSKLRSWMRRQIKVSSDKCGQHLNDDTESRVCACRYMDEIFVAVSGSKDMAMTIKDEILSYLKNSLYLDAENWTGVSTSGKDSRGVQFVGTLVRIAAQESSALRAVHKLQHKIRLFASQKQEIWDAMTLRIGKMWLAYGLRRIKESEIKSLGLSTPLLDYISQFRKDGMKTDHWFKSLLKIWMQDVNAKSEANEDILLSKCIAEPALPQDLRDSFYNFQKQAEKYVSLERSATLELLQSSHTYSSPSAESKVIRLEAPINFIARSLRRYGLVNMEGFPRHVSTLVLQDDDQIISWFAGLVRRWTNWYNNFDNFGDIKFLMVDCIRKSCIRTLAAKYRTHEVLIEKKFELEQNGIPLAEDLDSDFAGMESSTSYIDDALMYGMSYSGLCMLSLSRVKVPARTFHCFVLGCTVVSPSMYILHVKEKQKFPGWKTGFSTCIPASLHRRRIGLCSQHVKDLYLGHISLQSIEFGALNR